MWGAIKKVINSNLNKSLDILIQEKATETNSKIDNRASQTSVDSINTNVGTLLNGRTVKSVQSGVATSSITEPITVSHSSVNVSKSIILLNGSNNVGAGDGYAAMPYVMSKNSTNFVFGFPFTNTTYPISWQVIEFY